MEFDWLIIGGGLHGVHVATRLVEDGGVKRERLGIIDPEAQLLDRWRERSQVTGMTHMRSPVMHHIDTGPYALLEFAGTRPEPASGDFIPPNDRPALGLFNDHCQHVIERTGLGQSHIQDRVADMESGPNDVVLTLGSGSTVRSKRVVVAIGEDENFAWPDAVPVEDPRVSHVFSRGLKPQAWPAQSVCVLGGGISAAQVSLHLARLGHHVSLISRHQARVHQYDSDPGWFGPKFMAGFEELDCLERRRTAIAGARNRGSVTPDVQVSLRKAMARDGIAMFVAAVEQVETADPELRIVLDSGEEVCADRIVCATGFSAQRPRDHWLGRFAAEHSLPFSPCGYPVLDRALRWHPRLHVSGGLAELELGPIARNIAGARRAGDRILTAL
jgi:cation diffusion facilitator CzcD-associated flavoprotein CzcO